MLLDMIQTQVQNKGKKKYGNFVISNGMSTIKQVCHMKANITHKPKYINVECILKRVSKLILSMNYKVVLK